ncbi:MAG: Flp pilus assembly protein CpaB [Chloroflexota bacterium]|nr:Flp pilus assembly protein CpaB [Chloroflexota bacterium]
MKRSNRLVLLVGVFLAILAFVGIIVIIQGNSGSTGPKVAEDAPTVYAAKPIALGTEITADMLETKTTKLIERDPTAFSSPSLLLGKIAAKDVAQGKQLTADDFNRGAGITQVTVPAGMRAIAVQVDQVSGVGTVIRTGDYVDLLVGITGDKFPVITAGTTTNTFTVVSGINATSAKLLLQGMQVVGTLLPPPTAAATGQAASPAPGGNEPATNLNGQNEIVILAVTPQQAEVIKFAQMDGSVSMILRSPKDFRDDQGNPIVPAPAGTTGVTLKVLVDEYRVLIPQLVETTVPAQAKPH